MKRTPCEYIVWNILPCLRKKLAEALLRKGLKQKEIAEKLGVSSAAVSQYLSNKRGLMEELGKKTAREVEKSAEAILKGGNATDELCRICAIIKEEHDLKNIIC